MKLKDGYYSQQGWEQRITSLDSWLRMKDDFYRHHTALMHHFGIKLQPKHRHRRSIAHRDLHRLFPKHKIMLGAVWIRYDGGWGVVDYPHYKDRVWKGCHRLVWR